MDYARFNYVAQPEDGVTALFPRIETMTNGLLNGDIPILKTLKTRHRKSVVERND
jgi:hypothetical protein